MKIGNVRISVTEIGVPAVLQLHFDRKVNTTSRLGATTERFIEASPMWSTYQWRMAHVR